MLNDYYSSEKFKNVASVFKKKCREHNCILKGNLDEYIVLDGDEIEKCLSGNKKKSTDCIIIDKMPDEDNNVEVVLCELCRGSKDFNEVKEKIINSAEHIVEVFNDSQFDICRLKCCYLGKYGDYKRSHKLIAKPINIRGFSSNDVLIENYNCGTDIETLKKN